MNSPLVFVTWLWKPKRIYRSQFCAHHVNVLASMIRRNYRKPHKCLVVTDIPDGIDTSLVTVVKAWNDFAEIQSLYGERQPSCYRRLRAFHPEIGEIFGERFVSLDLDTVIVKDITPLFDRPEDFVIWKEQDPRSYFNGSIFMLRAGARPQVWKAFASDPKAAQRKAKTAGRFGSDQAIISDVLGRGEATWGKEDGVYSYRVDIEGTGVLPENARVVCFHGGTDPWSNRAMKLEWVQEHYRIDAAERVAC